VPARDNVPRAAARFHRVVHRGAALAFDHVALSIGDLKDQQLFIEIVGQRRIDRCEAFLAESLAILQDVAANELEANFMIALGLGVEFGVAAIRSVFGKNPIERSSGIADLSISEKILGFENTAMFCAVTARRTRTHSVVRKG